MVILILMRLMAGLRSFSLDRRRSVTKIPSLQSIVDNPAFAALVDLPRYKSIIGTLKFKLGVNEREKPI